MNLLLLDPQELVGGCLPANDERCQHIDRVLRSTPGTWLKAGVVGGARGQLQLLDRSPEGWSFCFSAQQPPLEQKPLTVLLAMSRPPVLRRLLRDLASLGCQRVLLFAARLSEGDYQRSHLWQQIPLLLREGAQQGGHTLLPQWAQLPDLASAMGRVDGAGLWCDCLPAPPLLRQELAWPLAVAIGPERGWSEAERCLALERGWQPVSLGESILRCELAAQLTVGLLCQRWEWER